ncbi:snapalysin family zinc-dependent metalloprotease [Stackebrandtia nassauensis]|uniref:Extracellular small neutral protease n=1 Tax=Stackebrandtia nassauensis (strain DSM 44728 / CIP 108903 / NRRL B-16338 / NBRC 102104 / LLR-40K-21) TaxID=446470 RepID=D3PZE6_STANL|nr:snapalysin family zinc-dependent metalloprotease [Stackebrandtia nassauensis]ADD41620.1 hypothetical protein Snas_1924 [Stackebrandtia nassauensis DSM 44728]
MNKTRIRTMLIGASAVALATTGGLLAADSAQADEQTRATTVYYSASGYQSEAAQAAQIWNDAVPNLNMVEGGNATITIEATTGGGSRAYPCGLGCASIYIDSQDVAAGHNPLRIVSHEIGHGHTLPDNYNGDCSILMSGGSAGTSCTNPNPSAGEADRVNSAYGGGKSGGADIDPGVYDPSLS